jgi:hypothetical protein
MKANISFVAQALLNRVMNFTDLCSDLDPSLTPNWQWRQTILLKAAETRGFGKRAACCDRISIQNLPVARCMENDVICLEPNDKVWPGKCRASSSFVES